MRRRLALLSLATTTLVVISLLLPLGLLVRRQAVDRAVVAAEREAQTVAALVGFALEGGSDQIAAAVGTLGDGVIVVMTDGTILGQRHPRQGSLIEAAIDDQTTLTSMVEGGWEIALPVIGRNQTVVVDVFVTHQVLTQGVAEAWALLGMLGLVLIGGATWVADRLGRRLVDPIRELAGAARRMGEGDLDVRVRVSEPEEIQEVGAAFNTLASRLEQLLIAERESVADLSHRLRTPLASLQLQAERIGDPSDRSEILAQVDRLEEAIDQLIIASRTRDDLVGRCDLSLVLTERAAFWRVLADEQDRELDLVIEDEGLEVELPADVVQALVDTLVGNVFIHTPAGTRFSVATGETEGRPWLEVSDRGPGFRDRGLMRRGVSGGRSTGLGLDIARRTAEMTGGELVLNDRPGGGAVVRVWFGRRAT